MKSWFRAMLWSSVSHLLSEKHNQDYSSHELQQQLLWRQLHPQMYFIQKALSLQSGPKRWSTAAELIRPQIWSKRYDVIIRTNGERGWCCLHNPYIFLPIHQYCFLFKWIGVRQLCLPRINKLKNKDSGIILIIRLQENKSYFQSWR